MKKIQVFIILSGLAILPFFQNCGMSAAETQSGGLFVGEGEPDCLSTVVDCGPSKDFLEITIDLSNPSVFPAVDGGFFLYGRCNVGNFARHGVKVSTYLSSNPGTPIMSAIYREDDEYGCKRGKYSMPIPFSVGYDSNTAYFVIVTMIGYDDEGVEQTNPQASGTANIDISKQ